MSQTVIRTFDLYNTTFYWLGYAIPNYQIEQSVAQANYFVNFSSNIIGSQIDFFNTLTGISAIQNTSNVFSLSVSYNNLPYLWQKYWWDEAMYYSHPLALSAIKISASSFYQPFSESVGSLLFTSEINNFKNAQAVPYNNIIASLLLPGISSVINSFYQVANSLFVTNIANIGPGTGTDTIPNNSNLIMADTDLTRILSLSASLPQTINNLYLAIYAFLPFNTTVNGNLFTPYYWSVSANCEDVIINVSINNTSTSVLDRQLTETLIAT